MSGVHGENRKRVTSVTSLPAAKKRESSIEDTFRRACRRYGGEAVKLGHSGKPDQLVLWDKGVTTYAELKRPGEEPEPHQQVEIDKMKGKGHLVMVVRCERDMAVFIAESLKRVMQE